MIEFGCIFLIGSELLVGRLLRVLRKEWWKGVFGQGLVGGNGFVYSGLFDGWWGFDK